MCRCEGYGFQAVYSRIGYINQSVWVQNRVSLFRKLISWLKILSRLGKQLLQDRGILRVYSSIGQQNSAELALVKVKGSSVSAAHPHPEIPKVHPPGVGPPQPVAAKVTVLYVAVHLTLIGNIHRTSLFGLLQIHKILHPLRLKVSVANQL